MKYTLLELTQAVLSSMDSDEVNSINDTVESQQVVEIIKTVYDDIISRSELVSNKTIFNLTASTDLNKPVLMFKPAGIERIEWVKYDIRGATDTFPTWRNLQYVNVQDFIDYMHHYNQLSDSVTSFTHVLNGHVIQMACLNDSMPQYYTSFDDDSIFFDAYDASVDSTLQASKTLCYGSKATEFTKADSFIPALQPQQFALLLNEAKSLAWVELKQAKHEKAEQYSRRNWINLQKSRQEIPNTKDIRNSAHSFNLLPNFARKK